MIGIKLTIAVSTESLTLAGSRIARAISDGITDTLKDAQTVERAYIGTEFTIRRKQFKDLSVKITQFPSRDSLVGILAIRSPGDADRSNIFGKFELGGTKTARGGGLLAVPITGSLAKPTAGSIVKPQWKPSALLASGITSPTGGRVFFRNTKSGTGKVLLIETGVVSRTKTGRARKAKRGEAPQQGPRALQPLFLFIKSAPIAADLRFVGNVTRTISNRWSANFSTRWREQQARAER